MNPHWILPAGFLLLFGMTLPGCDNNPYPSGESSRSVLYRSLADDPRSLDPGTSYNAGETLLIASIYATFYHYDYLKRDPFQLDLYLGAETPKREPYPYSETIKGKTTHKTGEIWTFKIKRGIHFQDDPCFKGGVGREVTAADLLFSFRRMADPAVQCPVQNYFSDKILGFADYIKRNSDLSAHHRPVDYRSPIKGLQLDPEDPYVLRIVLTQPYPQLRYLMAMPFTAPVPHEAVERYGVDLTRHPVGCGAYEMAEFTPRQRIILKANPKRMKEFYPNAGMPGDKEAGLLADAGKPLPLTDEIVFTEIREGITGWNLFQQGYLDSWGVTQENYQKVMSRQGELSDEMKRKGVQMIRDVSPYVEYFAFNMDDPVFGGYSEKKRKLRQAISLSIDSQTFIDLFSQGIGKPADFLIPPGIVGYDTAYHNPYRQYNVEKAKRLLKEAGYPNGIDPKTGDRLTLYYDNTGTDAAGRQLVGWVKKQIEAIGIHLESRSWRDTVMNDRINKGEFQFAYNGWIADYPDPENFALLLYGPNYRPGPNMANYNNPQFNRLFDQMRSMEDGPARKALIGRMRDIAAEDCPWIYIQYPESLGLHYDWLSNAKVHPVAYDTLKYLRIDAAKRARLRAEWNRPNYWPAILLTLFLTIGSLPAIGSVRRHRKRRIRRDVAINESLPEIGGRIAL